MVVIIIQLWIIPSLIARLLNLCKKSETLDHHSLHFSDHLPVSLTIDVSKLRLENHNQRARLNWKRALQTSDVNNYCSQLQNCILSITNGKDSPKGIEEVEMGIEQVSKAMLECALNTIPKVTLSHVRSIINDKGL